MKYTGVNHLAFATGDMDITIRFWRDLLGMRLVLGGGGPGYRQYFFEVSSTDLVAFFEWPDVKPVVEREHGVPKKGPFVFDHVSFGLPSEDALYELKDRLNAADEWVSEVIDHGFIYSIYTFDPNGIPLEFSVNIPGIDIRNEPVMVDTEPSDITKEGVEPRKDVWPSVTEPTRVEDRRTYPGHGADWVSRKQ